MTAYTLLVTEEAEVDLQEASDWYGLADPGLETEFLRTIEACLESIRRNPKQYPQVYKTFTALCSASFLTAFFTLSMKTR